MPSRQRLGVTVGLRGNRLNVWERQFAAWSVIGVLSPCDWLININLEYLLVEIEESQPLIDCSSLHVSVRSRDHHSWFLL